MFTFRVNLVRSSVVGRSSGVIIRFGCDRGGCSHSSEAGRSGELMLAGCFCPGGMDVSSGGAIALISMSGPVFDARSVFRVGGSSEFVELPFRERPNIEFRVSVNREAEIVPAMLCSRSL